MFELLFGFYLYQSLFMIYSMVLYWRDYYELQDFTILQVLELETILVPLVSPVFSVTEYKLELSFIFYKQFFSRQIT